jgi:hypothetical protein
MADFFTTGHDGKTISSYLQIIKDATEKFKLKRCFQIAPIIVTDFCWPIINAVIETFNNSSFEAYINWCADILIMN